MMKHLQLCFIEHKTSCVSTVQMKDCNENLELEEEEKIIFIKKNAFSKNFQGKIWFKCALSQPENVIATNFSKKLARI